MNRCGPGDDWKLIIDFPFDSEGHSPIEDLDRLNKFREKNERQRTLVWLPSFFSTRTQAELGKLVIIDRLLLGNNLDQYAKHLSLQDRQTARLLLQNQQSALSQRLLQAVEAAYRHPFRADAWHARHAPTTCRSRTSSRCTRPWSCSARWGRTSARPWSTCSIRRCRTSSRSTRSSGRRSSPARI